MKNVICICIFISINFIFSSEEENEIPKLDLRNSDLKIELNIDNIFKNPIQQPNILIQEQINEIKQSAKNYQPTIVTNDDIVVLETNFGTMKLKLYPEIAPNHCKNFKKLCNSGFYDGTIFFRVVPNFMIQGGDILSRDGIPENDGTGNPGWTIDAELNNIEHTRGTLSMAHGTDINSAGSQFFICVNDARHLNSSYTVFGEVVENFNVLDIITNIPSESKQVLSMSMRNIPKDENSSDWLSYDFNKNKYFFKIPFGQTKESFKKYISQKINNLYRPSIPTILKKIRILNKNSIPEINTKDVENNPYYNFNKSNKNYDKK